MNKLFKIFLFFLCYQNSEAQQLQLCGTQPILVMQLSATIGAVPNTAKQQAWLYWQVAQSGDIAFTLYPLLASDDLDFVLYRKNGEQWEALRTMQSGQLLGASNEASNDCMGPCGLHHSAKDFSEAEGCSLRQDNFLAPIQAFVGEEYALVISNYKGTNGFWWEYQGTANIATPNLNTSNTSLRSDKIFTSQSAANTALTNIENVRESKPCEKYIKSGMTSAKIYENKTIAGCTNATTTLSNSTINTTTIVKDYIGEPQPNPTHNEVQLALSFSNSTDLKYTIFQSNGALIEQQNLHFEKGNNQIVINTSTWQSASYMMVLTQGENITTKIIIKE